MQQLLSHRIGRIRHMVQIPHQRNTMLADRYPVGASNENVFGLQVRVDDTADSMQVVQTNQRVSRNLAYGLQRNALEIPLLDEGQQIGTHGLENHADMFPIGTIMLKVVHQLDHAREGHVRKDVSKGTALCGVPVAQATTLGSFREKFNFIIGRFGVMWSTLLDLHRDKTARVLTVLAQPHRGEVSPTELGDDTIPAVVHLTHRHDVVTPFAITVRPLVIALHVIVLRFGASHHEVLA
mmetsp:Transcript_26330/g.69227  ORF Transcript_26330/g.69227 Transcript_26330/m.69227 type:complete len:238 (+) Transcript_26330:1387-2100(+)